MSVTTEMVKELREETGAGVLEVKNALEAANGNYEQAKAALRAKGAAKAAKRAGREANEGIIEVYGHPGNRVGVILEVNCETDFVAKNDQFQTLAHDLVLHIAAMQPKYIKSEDVPEEIISDEKSVWEKQALAEGKSPEIAEKVVEGRLKKFYEENCLVEQPFVKDDQVKVKDLILEAISKLGENIVVSRFERYELGE
jgi:elongation factor Ts